MHPDRRRASSRTPPGAPATTLAAALAAAALLLAPGPATAQDAAADAVGAWVEENQHAVVAEFTDLLRIPNVASDSANMRRNARRLADMLEERGASARLLETGGPPYVYGERRVPGAERTLLVYAHYDGQPVDPSAWEGHSPWEPVLRTGSLAEGAGVRPFPGEGEAYRPEWRIYARSASDDKGGTYAILTALRALDAAGIAPGSNLRFLFEGDEEAGSPHIGELVREHGDLLSADAAIIVDGPVHPSGLPTVFYGVRGITTATITVYGPLRPAHSGHYGNWAPNPAMRLAHLLSSMKDPGTGRVRVEGWYDDVVPLSDAARQAIAELPGSDEARARAMGFAEPEGGGKSLMELINLPSLNVRGLASGWVGDEVRTIVPATAVAELDLRLVKDIRPADQLRRLRAHVEARGYHVVDGEPSPETRLAHPRLARVDFGDGGYPAMRTSMDLPVARAVADAVAAAGSGRAARIPTLGGSLPLHHFSEGLGLPTMGVPIANHDNNQHAPNENIRIGNLFRGIRTLAAVMAMP